MKNKLKKMPITCVPVLKEEIKKLWVLITSKEFLKNCPTACPEGCCWLLNTKER
jgi:hypothetical protein